MLRSGIVRELESQLRCEYCCEYLIVQAFAKKSDFGATDHFVNLHSVLPSNGFCGSQMSFSKKLSPGQAPTKLTDLIHVATVFLRLGAEGCTVSVKNNPLKLHRAWDPNIKEKSVQNFEAPWPSCSSALKALKSIYLTCWSSRLSQRVCAHSTDRFELLKGEIPNSKSNESVLCLAIFRFMESVVLFAANLLTKRGLPCWWEMLPKYSAVEKPRWNKGPQRFRTKWGCFQGFKLKSLDSNTVIFATLLFWLKLRAYGLWFEQLHAKTNISKLSTFDHPPCERRDTFWILRILEAEKTWGNFCKNRLSFPFWVKTRQWTAQNPFKRTAVGWKASTRKGTLGFDLQPKQFPTVVRLCPQQSVRPCQACWTLKLSGTEVSCKKQNRLGLSFSHIIVSLEPFLRFWALLKIFPALHQAATPSRKPLKSIEHSHKTPLQNWFPEPRRRKTRSKMKEMETRCERYQLFPGLAELAVWPQAGDEKKKKKKTLGQSQSIV